MSKRRDTDSLKKQPHKAQKKSISVNKLLDELTLAGADLGRLPHHSALGNSFGFDAIRQDLLDYRLKPNKKSLANIEMKISAFLVDQKSLSREERSIFNNEVTRLFDQAKKNRNLRTLNQIVPYAAVEAYEELAETVLDAALKGFFSRVLFIVEAVRETIAGHIKMGTSKTSTLDK